MDFIQKFERLFWALKDEKLINYNPEKAFFYLKEIEKLLEDFNIRTFLEAFFPKELNEFYYRGGVLYFLIGDYNKALSYLDEVNDNFHLEVLYYKTLIYIKKRKIKEAKQLLKRFKESYKELVTQNGFSHQTRLYQTMLEELERELQKLEVESLVLVINQMEPILVNYTTAKYLVDGDYIDLVNLSYKLNGVKVGFEKTLIRRIALLLSLPPLRLIERSEIEEIYKDCHPSLKSQDLKRLQKGLRVVLNQKRIIEIPFTLIVPCIWEVETCYGLNKVRVKPCQKIPF